MQSFGYSFGHAHRRVGGAITGHSSHHRTLAACSTHQRIRRGCMGSNELHEGIKARAAAAEHGTSQLDANDQVHALRTWINANGGRISPSLHIVDQVRPGVRIGVRGTSAMMQHGVGSCGMCACIDRGMRVLGIWGVKMNVGNIQPVSVCQSSYRP